MATSYNGWTASPVRADLGIAPLVVAGESFTPGVRGGDVHYVFTYVATQLHNRVESLVKPEWHQADDWGYAYRQNVNDNNLSCHASGTAIDYNATRHPNGKRGTFTAEQVNTIRHICKIELQGHVRWGGDFLGTPDEMHFEILGTPNQISALVFRMKQALHKPPTPTPAPVTPPQPWLMLPAVRSRPLSFQRWYNAYPFRPALLPIIKPLANSFGPQSLTALKKVQSRYGLIPDGVDGPKTKKLLWDLGWRG